MLRNSAEQRVQRMAIGIADSVPKSVASRLLKPVPHQSDVIKLICHEGRLASLMADLAIHRLNAVLADRPMPPNVAVRAFSHLLGESTMSLFGTPSAFSAFICEQYKVECLGELPDVTEQLYLITTARRLTHPAMVAMTRVAHEEIFAVTAASNTSSAPAT